MNLSPDKLDLHLSSTNLFTTSASGFFVLFGSLVTQNQAYTVRTSPDFECLKSGWFAIGLDFEWDLKSGSPSTYSGGSNTEHVWYLYGSPSVLILNGN